MAKRTTSAVGVGVRVLLWPLPILLIVVIALGARLVSGPINVPVPERALDAFMAQAAPGWQMETSGAEFDLFGKGGLTGLKLRDVRVRDAAGDEMASVPELGLSMSLSPHSTARKAVEIRGIRLSGAQIDVTRDREGRFSVGIGGLSDAVLPLNGLSSEETGSVLPRIELTDATLRYRDDTQGVGVAASVPDARLDPDGRLRLAGLIETGDGDTLSLDMDATRQQDGNLAIKARFENLLPSFFASLDPALDALSDVAIPLNGTLSATLAPDATPIDIHARILAARGGTVMAGGGPRRIDRFSADLTYRPDNLHADIRDMRITEDGLSFSADASLQYRGAGRWSLEATAPGIAYTAPDGALAFTAKAVALSARSDAGSNAVGTIKMGAPTLDLPAKGIKSTAGTLALSGTLHPDIEAITLATIVAEDIDAARDDHAIRVKRLASKASFADDTVILRDMTLDGIVARHDEARLAMVGMSGAVQIEGMGKRLVLKELSGHDVQAALPDGREIKLTTFKTEAILDPAQDRLSVSSFHTPRAIITLSDFYDAPLTLDGVDLMLDQRGSTVKIPGFNARLNGIAIGAKATISHDIYATRAQIDLDAGETDFRKIAPLWPKGVAPGGRHWVRHNIHDGHVSNITLDARFDTSDPAQDALALAFDFKDAIATAIPGMPPIRHGRGHGLVSLDRLDVFLDEGRVVLAKQKGFTLGKSRFSIPDFSPDTPEGHVALRVKGPAQSILRFLDHEPLDLITSSGFDIAKARGDVAGKVQVKLPLDDDISLEDVDFRANADIRDFMLYEPHVGVQIAGDTMAIAVKPDGLKFRADAKVDGLSARLEYAQAFETPLPGKPESVLTLQSYLTREDFALRAGMDVSDYFDGVAVLDAKIDLFPGGGARFAANADLSGSTLRSERLGWVKTDGVPVTVALAGFRNPDGAGQIDKIAVRGTGIAANGRVSFDTDGEVQLVDFDRIVLTDSLDAGIRYLKGSDASIRRVEVAGAFLDLRRAFSDALDASKTPQIDPPPPIQAPILEIATRLAAVKLRDDLIITDVNGGMHLSGERVMGANFKGAFNGVAPAQLHADRRLNDDLTLLLTSEDAGAFLDTASVFKGATGGKLRLDARMRSGSSPSRIVGLVQSNGITIRNSQTMRQILSGGAVASLARQMLSGGLTFSKVALPFTGIGGRWSIADGVAWGSALGLTLDGTYDIERKGIDLRGTLSPAYAINGALGSVPLLGGLLTGGEGEGIFGITFAVSGTTQAPKVWVNPLSALAPGFLRKIVSGVMDGQNVARAAGTGLTPFGAGEGR